MVLTAQGLQTLRCSKGKWAFYDAQHMLYKADGSYAGERGQRRSRALAVGCRLPERPHSGHSPAGTRASANHRHGSRCMLDADVAWRASPHPLTSSPPLTPSCRLLHCH